MSCLQDEDGDEDEIFVLTNYCIVFLNVLDAFLGIIDVENDKVALFGIFHFLRS